MRVKLMPGVLAATLSLAAAAVVAAPSASAGTGDNDLRVIQHNTDMGGYQSAIDEANGWGDVDAVTFQELCESQKIELEQAGWKVHWKSQRNGNSKCAATADGGTRKGNAIATKRGMGDTTTTNLGQAGGRTFRLLCAHITGTGISKSWVCTTHLALSYDKDGWRDGPANRERQVGTITGKLNGWVADGRRVVLTGDLNAAPSSKAVEPLYRVTGNGTDSDRFWEGDQGICDGALCRDMAVTTDAKEGHPARKIDYFFASWRGVDPRSGVSKLPVDSGTSGHHVVRGRVTFKPLG